MYSIESKQVSILTRSNFLGDGSRQIEPLMSSSCHISEYHQPWKKMLKYYKEKFGEQLLLCLSPDELHSLYQLRNHIKNINN